MENSLKENFLLKAIKLAEENIINPLGRPFGAIIVRNNVIIGQGINLTVIKPDPTAHAEIEAIRDAAKYLNEKYLDGCDLYTSCEPCPMCLSACYWANIKNIYYSASSNIAQQYGFSDNYILEQLRVNNPERDISMVQLLPDKGFEIFELWNTKIKRSK